MVCSGDDFVPSLPCKGRKFFFLDFTDKIKSIFLGRDFFDLALYLETHISLRSFKPLLDNGNALGSGS